MRLTSWNTSEDSPPGILPPKVRRLPNGLPKMRKSMQEKFKFPNLRTLEQSYATQNGKVQHCKQRLQAYEAPKLKTPSEL